MSGEAAHLAGKSRVEFLFALSEAGLLMSNLREEHLTDKSILRSMNKKIVFNTI